MLHNSDVFPFCGGFGRFRVGPRGLLVVLYRTFRHSLVTAITLLFPEETAGIPEAFLPTVSLIGCISTPPSPGQVTIAIVSSPKTDLLGSLAGLEPCLNDSKPFSIGSEKALYLV